jgi:hypothetical protein
MMMNDQLKRHSNVGYDVIRLESQVARERYFLQCISFGMYVGGKKYGFFAN